MAYIQYELSMSKSNANIAKFSWLGIFFINTLSKSFDDDTSFIKYNQQAYVLFDFFKLIFNKI